MKELKSGDMVLIYSTFPDKHSAEMISKDLVDLKLAACANIFQGMVSLYEWKGEMQRDDEVSVLFKTTKGRLEELSKKLRQLHPYDTPAIVGFGASYVEATYLAWLQAQTKV